MAFKIEKPVMFSEYGYKRYSPDVNNKQNLIATGDITMKDVDFPVHGIDNEGNEKIMEPGKDYKFPGDVVLETPLNKNKNKNKMAFKLKSGNKTSFKMMGSSPMKQGEHEGVHGEKEEPESKQYPEQDTLSAESKIKASGSATAGQTKITHEELAKIAGGLVGAGPHSMTSKKLAKTFSEQLKKKL
tara:strand:+ start:1307 stop:1864 length:558 start_codon:yes stop_codon:yes gene_type:complete